MVMRELDRRKVETSRQKGIDYANKIMQKFTDDMTTDQKLDLLCQGINNCIERVIMPTNENFDGEEFFNRKNNEKSRKVELLMLNFYQGVSMMERALAIMDEIGRNKMNGHSDLFLKYRDEADRLRKKMYEAKELYEDDRAFGRKPITVTGALRIAWRVAKEDIRRNFSPLHSTSSSSPPPVRNGRAPV